MDGYLLRALILGIILFIWGCREAEEKRVYFSNLVDGAKVHSPFRLKMNSENLVIDSANKGMDKGHGYFQLFIEPAEAILHPQASEFRLNFFEGQREAIVNLPKGEHFLTLLFVQGNHVSVNPPIFQKIRINVVAENNCKIRFMVTG